MRLGLPVLIGLSALIYILIVPPEPVGWKIFAKLIPMALIILYAATRPGRMPGAYKRIITIGLFVCMIADGVIYWFIAGLVTFLIGHLFYIAAFRRAAVRPMPVTAGVLLGAYGAGMALLVAFPLLAEGDLLGIAVLAYMLVILMMGWTAVRTGNPLAILGALLFILSDSVLAIDRFTFPIAGRDALVMVPYYAAQFLIAASIARTPAVQEDEHAQA
ncbi:lysoplasmalogenase [Bhargavaea beijingensis]|uniref:Lysoplasmalogenase n=1 Tax=Bhargavaea beijingensis TaxID=426756 RepID=A0A1G6YRU3_9BACL|nr:lysoplasmalogenase [Bhargavaea beijingensis]RSK36641.1 lysoplasmalogenase [Bhargavaea beijingensis]SDD93050.1 Uncharacterized membrane protein YhhN [Bhargavaea beijingensis]